MKTNSVKLFDLRCNGFIKVRQRPMPMVKAMMNMYKSQSLYKGCRFTISYNSIQK